MSVLSIVLTFEKIRPNFPNFILVISLLTLFFVENAILFTLWDFGVSFW